MLLRCSAKGYVGGLDRGSADRPHLLTIPPLEANPASFTTTIDSAQLERYRNECNGNNTTAPSSSSLQLMLDECVKPALANSLLDRWAMQNTYHVRITQQQQQPTSIVTSTVKEVRQLRFGTLTSTAQLVEALLVPATQTRDESLASPWVSSRHVEVGARLVEYVGGAQKVVHTPLSPDLWKYFMLKGTPPAAAETPATLPSTATRTPTSFALELYFVLLLDGISGECRPVDSSTLVATTPPINTAAPKKDPLLSLIDTVQDYALGIHKNNDEEQSPHSSDDENDDDQVVAPVDGAGDTHITTPQRSLPNTALRDARRKRRTHTVGVHKLFGTSSQQSLKKVGSTMKEPRELVSPAMAMSLGVLCSRLGGTTTPATTTAEERLEYSLASHRNALIYQRMVSRRRGLLRRSAMMPSDLQDLSEGDAPPVVVPFLSPESQLRYAYLWGKLGGGKRRAVVNNTDESLTTHRRNVPQREIEEEEPLECMPTINAPTVKTRTSMRKEEHNSQFRLVGGVQTRISLIGNLKPNHERGASRPSSPQESLRRNQRVKRRHLMADGGRIDVSDMYASSSTGTDADTGDRDTPLPGSMQQQGEGTTTPTHDEDDGMNGIVEDTTVSCSDDTSSSDASSPPPPPYRRNDGEVPIGIRQGMKSFTRPKQPHPSHNLMSLEASMVEHRTDMSFAGFNNSNEHSDMVNRRGTITPADADEMANSRGSMVIPPAKPTDTNDAALLVTPLTRKPSAVRKGRLKSQPAGPPQELERSPRPMGNMALEASEQMEVPATAERLAWNRAYTQQEQTAAESMQTMSRRLGASHQARANSLGNEGGEDSTPPEGPDIAPGDWTVPLRPPSCTMRTYTRREHTRAVYLRQYIEHQERVQLQKSKENIIAAMRLLAKMPNYEEDAFEENGIYEDEGREVEPSSTFEGAAAGNGRATYPPVGAVGARPQGSPTLSFKPLCRYGSAKPSRVRRSNNNTTHQEEVPIESLPAPQLPTLATSDTGSGINNQTTTIPRATSSEGSDSHCITSPRPLSNSYCSNSPSPHGAGYFYFGEVPYGRTSALSFHSDGFASISSTSFNSRPASSAPKMPPSGGLSHDNTMINFAPHRPSIPKNDDAAGGTMAIVRKSSRPSGRPPPRAAPLEEEEDESPPRPIHHIDTTNKTVRFSDMANAGGNAVAMVEESSDLFCSTRANMTITCFAQTRAPPTEPTPLEEVEEPSSATSSSKPMVVTSGIFSTQSGAEWEERTEDDDEKEEEVEMEPTNLPKRESSIRPKVPVPPTVYPTTAAPRRRTLPQPIFALELEDENGEEPVQSPPIGIRRPMSFHVPFNEIPEICIVNRTPSVLSARSHDATHSGSDLEEGTPLMTYKINSVVGTPLAKNITPPTAAVLVSSH